MTFDFQDFSIDLTKAIQIESFDETDYCGIIFKMADVRFRFQVIHNKLMGYRIYIYDDNGHLQDIPFHKGTAGFLPDGIKITWRA